MSHRAALLVAVPAAVFGATDLRACLPAEHWPGPRGPQPIASASAVELGASIPPPAPPGAHPRILLTPDRLATMRGLRDGGASSWRRLVARCDDDVHEAIPSGYEAWDWSNATLDLALCNTVSPHPEYSRAAVRYFSALLDDRYKVGDGAGGDEVVHHDDGYSIRTRGCFGAIAYDWLHDAPRDDPRSSGATRDRFAAWTRWFAASGYGRDEPIANYYVGWFGAVAFAGIAADGDGDDRMTQLSRDADRMYGREIVPAYSRKLDGGDFPEGWQYGDLVGAVLAIYADARTSASRSAFDDLPWLRQSVVFRGHALWPDAKHTLDTGDWSVKACRRPGPRSSRALRRPAAGRRRRPPGEGPRAPRQRSRRRVAMARRAGRRPVAHSRRPARLGPAQLRREGHGHADGPQRRLAPGRLGRSHERAVDLRPPAPRRGALRDRPRRRRARRRRGRVRLVLEPQPQRHRGRRPQGERHVFAQPGDLGRHGPHRPLRGRGALRLCRRRLRERVRPRPATRRTTRPARWRGQSAR